MVVVGSNNNSQWWIQPLNILEPPELLHMYDGYKPV